MSHNCLWDRFWGRAGQLQSQKSLRKLPQPCCFLISKVVNNSYLVTHVLKFLETLGK